MKINIPASFSGFQFFKEKLKCSYFQDGRIKKALAIDKEGVDVNNVNASEKTAFDYKMPWKRGGTLRGRKRYLPVLALISYKILCFLTWFMAVWDAARLHRKMGVFCRTPRASKITIRIAAERSASSIWTRFHQWSNKVSTDPRIFAIFMEKKAKLKINKNLCRGRRDRWK